MWHVSHGEKNFGPFSEEKMLALIKAGKLPPTVHVWKDGMADWVLLRDSPLMMSAAPALVHAVAPAVPVAPAVAANPFDFSQPAARSSQPAAAINVAVAPQPTAQQLANPYFSDFNGQPAVAQPAAAAANPNFRLLRLEGLQLFVIITTAIAALVSLGCAWVTLKQILLFNEAKKVVNGGNGRTLRTIYLDAEASDQNFALFLLGFAAAGLVMSIAFLIWFYRAHVNAKAMSTAKFEDTSGWAVGYFFIPFLNFYKPFVGMRDIWRGSFSAPGSFAAPPSTLVTLWWGTTIGVNFLNRLFVFRFLPDQATSSDYVTCLSISLIGNLLLVVSLGLLVMLVLKITKQQSHKAQQIANGTGSLSPKKTAQMPQFQF